MPGTGEWTGSRHRLIAWGEEVATTLLVAQTLLIRRGKVSRFINSSQIDSCPSGNGLGLMGQGNATLHVGRKPKLRHHTCFFFF